MKPNYGGRGNYRRGGNIKDARDILRMKQAQKQKNTGNRINRVSNVNRSSNQNARRFNNNFSSQSRFNQNSSNQSRFNQNNNFRGRRNIGNTRNQNNQNFIVTKNFQGNSRNNFRNLPDFGERISINRIVTPNKRVYSNSSGLTVVAKIPQSQNLICSNYDYKMPPAQGYHYPYDGGIFSTVDDRFYSESQLVVDFSSSRQFISHDDELEKMTLDDLPGSVPIGLISRGRTPQFLTQSSMASSSSSSHFRLGNDSMVADTISQNSQIKPCVIISNLLPSVSENDIIELFGSLGSLNRVQMKGNQAFVEYTSFDCAQAAVEQFDGVLLDGQAMHCNLLQRFETKSTLASRLGDRGNSSVELSCSAERKPVRFIVKMP